MPSNVNDQLRDLERREEEAVATASRLAESFVETAGRFAADWIAKHVNDEVTREHACVQPTWATRCGEPARACRGSPSANSR